MVTDEQLTAALNYNKSLAFKLSPCNSDDLIGAGHAAIMQAMKNYEPRRGTFLTYARAYIIRNQQRECTNICKGVSLPNDVADYPKKAEKYSKYELDAEPFSGDREDARYSILNTPKNLLFDYGNNETSDGEEFLAQALEMLGPKDRELIALFFDDENKLSDISDKVGIKSTHGLISNRVRTLIKRLRHNIALLSKGSVLLADRKIRLNRGRYTKEIKHVNHNTTNRKGKIYLFKNPLGNLVVIENLKDFCKKNDLKYFSMSGVSRNELKAYKGWRKG